MTSKLVSCHSDADTSLSPSSDGPQPQKPNVTAYFTEHLISEILSRLPVKILLRFRCVSKPWCSLIESPRFVKTHLNRSIECKTNTGFIIASVPPYSVDFDSPDNATAIEIDEPMKTIINHSAFVGSCNGLHCLFNHPVIFLWNPATRKCRKLPAVPTDFLRHFDLDFLFSLCGFGYDAINDDYKVLRILKPDGHALAGSEVTVYSLKTNSWRRLQNISSHFQISGLWGMFICGALHWLTTKTLGLESCLSILAFDLGVENYREVPMPKVQNKNNDIRILILAESLCVLEYHHCIHIDVWVMNDYGVEESWCKLFSVGQPKVIRSFETVRPIAYSKSRKDVLLEVDSKKVMWYNLERKKVKKFKIANMPDIFDLEIYTESLVPLYHCTCCDGKQPQKQPQEKTKQQQQQKKNERDKFLAKGFKLVL